jgi:hypothetical protein
MVEPPKEPAIEANEKAGKRLSEITAAEFLELLEQRVGASGQQAATGEATVRDALAGAAAASRWVPEKKKVELELPEKKKVEREFPEKKKVELEVPEKKKVELEKTQLEGFPEKKKVELEKQIPEGSPRLSNRSPRGRGKRPSERGGRHCRFGPAGRGHRVEPSIGRR